MGPKARIQIEETVNNFTNTQVLAVFDIGAGSLSGPDGAMLSFRKREAAGTDLFGTASAKVQVNLIDLDGTSPSVTYNIRADF